MYGRAKLEGDISQIKIAFRVPPDMNAEGCAGRQQN